MDEKLRQQAERLGIETAYCDADGVMRQADEDALRFLVDLLSRPATTIDSTLLPRTDPTIAYQPRFAQNGAKAWVLGVQLYSLMTATNWGHGDFADLMRLIDAVAEVGGDGIGLNPLHALDEDGEAGPYAPVSRLFLNPLYIDMARLPGLAADDLALKPPGDSALIDYQAVARAKNAALRRAHARLAATPDAPDWRDFIAFRAERGRVLQRYAVFCHQRKRLGRDWRDWPAPWRRPDPALIARHAADHTAEIGWREFAQFVAHRQLTQCRQHARERGMAVGLYLDLAVGVQADGFDAWNEPEAYLEGATIGAPPDPLNRGGQNWGLTAFNPMALRRQAYSPFAAMLAATMRYAGAIRIDHVLGLNRLYLIPPGKAATDGAYLAMPLGELLAAVAQESNHHRCLVIGEDLGTVPDGLRAQLRDHGVWTYRVMMFERGEGGFASPHSYPAKALVTFSTHDLPTFAGWMAGADIVLAQRLGLKPPETLRARQHKRRDLRRALGLAPRRRPAYADIVRFLAGTPCQLVSLSLEDLLGSSTQVNLPGTFREYPNWRHRLRCDEGKLRQALRQVVSLFPTRKMP